MLLVDNIIEGVERWFVPFTATKPAPEDDVIPAPGERKSTGSVTINGVELPKIVADQIQKLGVSLSWYSQYELESAVRACAVDCTLIDNPNAPDFLDELEKPDGKDKDDDDDEKKEEKELDPFRLNALHPDHAFALAEKEEYAQNFRERLRMERDREKRRKLFQNQNDNNFAHASAG